MAIGSITPTLAHINLEQQYPYDSLIFWFLKWTLFSLKMGHSGHLRGPITSTLVHINQDQQDP